MLFKKRKVTKESPYGWSGDFASWEEAANVSGGYDQDSILEKVKEAVLKVKNGEAVYERDSVIFDKKEYSWPLLAILLKVAIEYKNKLNLIDFGGSLGSSYFQNREFLSGLSEVCWNVVEQKNFVETGNKFIASQELKFFDDLQDCVSRTGSELLLASSVVQYLPSPYQTMQMFKDLKFKYIVFDRTAFIEGEKDMLTVQRVPPHVYAASYPAWFFTFDRFVKFFEDTYILVSDFDNGFTAPAVINSRNAYWRGLIFKRK